MKKKLKTLAKRTVSFVLAFFVIINFSFGFKAKALAGVDDILVFGIIAKLMIAAGVSSTYLDNWVGWQDEFKEDCTDVYNQIAGETTDGIGGEDRIILNPITMIYGYYINISDTWWAAVRAWVGSHFEEGENYTSGDHYSIFSYSYNNDYYLFGGENYYSYFQLVYQDNYNEFIITEQVNGKFTVDRYSTSSGSYHYIDQEYCFINYNTNTQQYILNLYPAFYWSNMTGLLDLQSRENSVLIAVGAQGIVGNDEWDYLNSLTGDRVINIPLDKDDAGDMVIGNVGFNVDEGTLSDQVIDSDYTDIVAENEDVIGVTVTDETGIVTDNTITDTSTGILQGVRETMLSLADTFPALFNAINNLGTSLALLIGNLPNLYLWVPSDTRGFIMTALSIAVLAVVYKIIRG